VSGLDVSAFSELKLAPLAVFEQLAGRGESPRFMVSQPDGEWRAVSWQQFADRISAFAAYLVDSGLACGDRAAILADNSVDWAAAALAIQAVGGVMVPIYPSSTTEQARYVIEHSDARVVFTDKEHPNLPGTVQLDVAAQKGLGRPIDLLARMRAVSLDAPGLMLYTSGTSGQPKGVPLTHRNVAVNGRDWLQCNAPGLHADGIDLLWLPLSHVFGFGEMCLGNTLGFTSWMSSPYTVMQDIQTVRPTVFMSVPSIWEKLAMTAMTTTTPERERAQLAQATGGRLQFCLSGGAGLKIAVKELFHRSGCLIIEGYGLTEASPTLTLNRPGDYRFDSVGKPLPSVEVKLAEDGEILARGPNVFGGYHKDPVATAEAFTEDGWLKTGDVGRFTDDGFLQIIDRKKDILVTAGGKNVPPANIEILFRDDPLVEHLVVFGDGRKYLTAGVWLRPTAPAAGGASIVSAVQASIDAHNQTLPRYMTIKRWGLMEPALTVENGFLTPTMKVKRKAVYAAFDTPLQALYD
jgi:long-chain acyl-CoA synthetase